MYTKALSLAFLAILGMVSAADMPTISAVGAKFFFSNGTQYYIKGSLPTYPSRSIFLIARTGIAYQLTSLDPLTNVTQCMLDATAMADLGANSIRVYHVDSTANHDACMSAFAARGIYLWLDLDTFDTQFEQACRISYYTFYSH